MKNVEQVLAAVADGEWHSVKDLLKETGCAPDEIETLVKRGFIRPIKGDRLCITPRGIERHYHGQRYIHPGGVRHMVYD